MRDRLILASRSPRRREILEKAGIGFVVRAAGVPEAWRPGEEAEAYVRRLAREKAEAVYQGSGIVLAADTVVVLDGRILEKPEDPRAACRILGMLNGHEHEVLTGICLLHATGCVVDIERTKVRFAAMTQGEIADYVASGEPMDKAGAYAIQGLGSKFVERVEGCYCNVVGLPLARVYRHLRALGWIASGAAGGPRSS